MTPGFSRTDRNSDRDAMRASSISEELCVFKGRHFDRSVIVLCVRWCLAYNLSLRDLEEMMAV